MYILGRSLGGAVAIHICAALEKAGDDYIKGVIIENTFTSISDMTDELLSFLNKIPGLKRLMLRLKWESIKEVKHIKMPILYISGD